MKSSSSTTGGVLVTPATRLLTLGMMAFVAWHLDRELALYSLATAPLRAVATVAFAKPLRRRNRLTRDVQARLASFVQQTLAAMPLVQAFDAERLNAHSWSSLTAEATLRTQRGLLLARSYGFVTGLISVCGSAVIIYTAGMKALSGTISVGTCLVFLAYLRNAQHAL